MRGQDINMIVLARPFAMMMLTFIHLSIISGQEKKVELRFLANENIECLSSTICYELQMKAEFGQTFEFGSANIRLYFDSADLTFQNFSCLLDGIYTCNGLNISSVSTDSIWDMQSCQFLQYNISGAGIPGFGDIIDGTDYQTFAEICFTPTDSIANGSDLFGSFVWDRLQDTAMGWQSQGIIFQEQSPDGILLLSLDEIPHHLNWTYLTPSSGIKIQTDDITWTCGVIPCITIVDNVNDVGEGSLRNAIGCADPGDTIRFSQVLAGQSIVLESEKIVVGKSLTILDDIIPGVFIQSNVNGVFEIAPGTIVKFQNLNIISGTGGTPAAILNQGELILHNAMIARNPSLPLNFNVLVLNAGQIEIQGSTEVKE